MNLLYTSNIDMATGFHCLDIGSYALLCYEDGQHAAEGSGGQSVAYNSV